MRCGEIWWATLPNPQEAESGYSRPVLMVQANAFTASRIRTVIAVMISRNLALANAPGNVLLPRKHTDLPDDSVANVSQIYTLDNSFLTEEAGCLPASLLRRVETGLRLVLAV
jgi:mRNA interferase MazF